VAALDEVLAADPRFRRTTIALKVVDLQTGRVLYDRGGDRLLTPASNLKIYTSACALDTFAPDHRFVTSFQATGPVIDGALRGDLLLIGGGDSMLTSDELLQLADQVVDAWGVRRVTGQVKVDRSRYGSPLKGPGWMWDDDPDYYNMSITPLMVDFNVLKLKIAADGQGGVVATLDPLADSPPILVEQLDADLSPATRRPFTEPILVDAQTPSESSQQRLTMHDPAAWIASLVASHLESRGVVFVAAEDPAVNKELPSGSPLLRLIHRGKSLAETLKHFHHVSENAVGEVLLHELAIAAGVARPKWSDGADVISSWLVTIAGLDPGSFRLVDGSGLSRYNLISADSSIRLLAFMRRHQRAAEFYDSLPTYDVGGKACVAAKSGGMASVSTISGYLDTREGRRLAFSLLANGFIGSNQPIRDLRGRVWETLTRYEHQADGTAHP
jgi:D-alanyl-D-alanine carboxypeptidase/D-alanyl-D-alanine-endopeptidase (penicillin-binding protein 4)